MLRFFLIALVAVTLSMVSILQPVKADQVFLEQPVEYNFNDKITFHVILESDEPVELAVIFFQDVNETQTFVELASVEKRNENEYDILHTHTIAKHRFQAFTTITYRFEIMVEGGEFSHSPQYEFIYSDNRFKWDSLQEGPFIVYWFDGDYGFAQSILDVAQEGLADITRILPMPEPEILHMYVYPDSALMKDALNPSGENWIAGHAYPDKQTMILFLPPDPDHILNARQRIPHEIMHILLYQHTGSGYENLPFWLVEGLASVVELYPNPDYAILLNNAYLKNELLPMNSLCDSFPRDASGALLAYAQSASFTNFLYSNYGTSGLQRLISGYADGLDCENGIQSALGVRLDQLERRWWRESLSSNPSYTAFIQMLPWLTVLLLVFIAPSVIIISSIRLQKAKRKIQEMPEQTHSKESSHNGE